MSPIRFATDEDVYAAISVQLRGTGFDALSTPEAGRMGESDESQLRWAVAEDRTIITFNVGDFARLHHEWMLRGEHHAGIIVSQQRPIGDVLRRLLNVANSLTSAEIRDRLEYLSNW